MQPVLLRASSCHKVRDVIIRPKDSRIQHVCVLHRQPIHMPVYHLTTSEEFPINVAHYEVAYMCHFSTTILITSSPTFAVHYEICPPSDKIEEFTNPRLRQVSELLLKPSDQCTSTLLTMNWLNVKLTTSYGIHSAVQRVIGTANIKKVKKLQAHRLQIQKHQAVDVLPQTGVCKGVLLRAPEMQKAKEVEEQFYDAVETCEISIVSSSRTVEICEAEVRNK